MTLDRNQTIDLLTVIAAYDRRTIGEGDIVAWSEAARRAGWTFPEAVDAAHEHCATSPKWLMPGHITELIRTKRRQPAPAAELLALDKPVASDETRATFVQQMARKLAERKDLNR